MIKRTTKTLFLMLAITALPLSLQAGWMGTIPALTEQDIAMISELTQQEMSSRPRGTTLTWMNPKSRNQGKVTLRGRFSKDQSECRHLHHEITLKNGEFWEIYTELCLDAEGQWHWRQVTGKEPKATP